MHVHNATPAPQIQPATPDLLVSNPLIAACVEIDALRAQLTRMQVASGEQLERTRAERARRLRADRLNDALSLRNDDLAGQVDELLLAIEAIQDADESGLPLDDAIRQARKVWELYGPSDTLLDGPDAAAPAALLEPDSPWPQRSPVDAGAIKTLIRDRFHSSGYHGTGAYCMWLEEELLGNLREVDALVAAVEACGPHIAAEILAKAGEVVAPKAASNG